MSATLTDPVAPSETEAELAKESSRRLSPFTKSSLSVQIPPSGKRREAELVELPAAAVQLLVRILTEMSAGNAVTLVPVHAEMTTQQAADFLNVSRPFLIKQLLDTGKIPFRKVGAHRRVLFRDLIEFKRSSKAEQSKAMDELVRQAQELDMGY